MVCEGGREDGAVQGLYVFKSRVIIRPVQCISCRGKGKTKNSTTEAWVVSENGEREVGERRRRQEPSLSYVSSVGEGVG